MERTGIAGLLVSHLLLAALALALGFNAGYVAFKAEAVKSGAARWVADTNGNPKFEFITQGK